MNASLLLCMCRCSRVATRFLVRAAHLGGWRAGTLRARGLPSRGVASCGARVLRSGTRARGTLVSGGAEAAAPAAAQQLGAAERAPGTEPAHAELAVRAVRARALLCLGLPR